MVPRAPRLQTMRAPAPPWNDKAPVRQELFGAERLEQHAASLAAAQRVTDRPRAVRSLRARLDDDAAALLTAYRTSATEVALGHGVVPAGEWLLDNFHVVEAQVREVRDALPPGFYRQLPKLAEGPFAGYPRVLGLAWAYVAHTDSDVAPELLGRFITAYQRVQPLTIGELWAIAITLRFVLIENLRRLADEIADDRAAYAAADALADRIKTAGSSRSWRDSDLEADADVAWRTAFAAQLAKRLRDQDPTTTPALGWLEERLGRQGTSIEGVLAFTQQRLGAANVTMRNIVTSMRLISDIDWAELFEQVSLVDELLRARSSFAAMDFATRDTYRSAIEELARGSDATELEVADRVLTAARDAAAADPEQARRVGDPGHFLIGDGRRAFERALGARASVRTRVRRAATRLGLPGYVGAIGLATALLVALVVVSLAGTGVGAVWLAWIAVAMVLPMSEVATALVNRLVTRLLGTSALPGLDLDTGVPSDWRTLVVVPTILSSEADLAEQIERLEVHHLGGTDGDLTFALLADGVDADAEELPGDEALLAAAVAAFEGLNRRHPPGPAGPRFLLLHRRRVYDAGQGVWMGWERKRGKLRELNRLLRGATDTTFRALGGRAPWVPEGVRFVLTLDADTRLPRGAAQKLVGKLAHPLNRPVLDATGRRVVRGYGVLQPRVTSPFPDRGEDSVFRQVFGAPSGIDPYASAVSDVYQDLFGEGSFTGKGIYDVEAFEAALAGRIPDATMLSHDLFEGVFARAGLATDVEVVEASPSRYDVAVKRQHRWTRGDWQLLPWLFGRRSGPLAVPLLGRWKMLDNLRRSLLAPAALVALVSSWFLGPIGSIVGVAFVLGALIVPAFLPAFYAVVPRRSGVLLRNHLATLRADVQRSAAQALLAIAFLPDTAWWMIDAVVRTLVRVFRTRRHLLEWTTAAQQASGPRLGVAGVYRSMAGGTLVALGAAALALALAPAPAWLVVPFVVVWAVAPAVARWISRPPTVARRRALPAADARELRLVARRTWRFFETFVTAEERHLPPDNFQEDPNPVVARRTSPTNVGLYLLSAVAARDFGWAGTAQTVARLEATLASVAALDHFRGHLFNWYATEDGRVLEPGYVSSVDSGNLAGHLLVLANACEGWVHAPRAPEARRGMLDALDLAREALGRASLGATGAGVADALDALEAGLRAPDAAWATLGSLVDAVVGHAAGLPTAEDDLADLAYWVGALQRAGSGHDDDAQLDDAGTSALNARLRAVATTARSMALAMDFSFLIDPERGLLSIGFSLDENGLDRSCYDLLASEARLASLFAIAKGDVETRHWFRLGRGAAPAGSGSVLLSWSGSMFEYLMPFLVMDAPVGSLLQQSQRHAVRRHQAYGARLDVPWGVSESAYAARDHEFTYQYANFGVPDLGLKRGLSESVVVAPYATGLATMVDPQRALQNFARLRELGALGRYGYYEALDYTPSRVPAGAPFTLVRSYMAHHQGMTVVAVANALDHGRMRARFHREPMVQAAELLLQERVPHDVVAVTPRADEVAESPSELRAVTSTVRRLHPVPTDAPVTHLLSNGRYAVMLTATGAGYSRWHDLAVTRWRADATRDECGSFVFLRDAQSGDVWSAGIEPIGRGGADDVVEFGEDHAEFIRRDGSLTTTTDVLISGEEDAEVRRVSLTNAGRRERLIDVTSYAELVLTSAAVDAAHPAFAKLFVQTEYLPESDALIATRRRRSPEEAEVWAAHLAVVEGETVGPTQFETDRAHFLGRSRSIGEAAAIVDARVLSNTVGTVLDPVFALRRRVRVPPGEVVRIAFWTVVAGSRSALMDAIDKHRDRSAYERAKTLAWTQAQVQMRFLDVTTEEAAEFQQLATPLLIADARFRAPGGAIHAGAGPQSGLWPHAISGDLPIVLLRIDDVADLDQVRQLLRAHEYWRLKRLAVDLVIVNEHAASYLQDLQVALETAVRSSQSRPRFGDVPAQGSVYVLRADLMTPEARALIRSVARVALIAQRGPIARQLARVPAAAVAAPVRRRRPRTPTPAASAPAPRGLEFFNGLGGFDADGRAYMTVLEGGRTTPMPWIDVIANPGFGFQVSTEGSGYTWAVNSRDHQLTPWSNDPVVDPAGEALYVRDEVSGDVWSPTAQPIRHGGRYEARFGFGSVRFAHEANGIALELLQYVPLEDPIKISRLTLHNRSAVPRRLSVTTYAEWVLGTSRSDSAPHLITEVDAATGALLVRNPWSTAYAGRVAFADIGERPSQWTGDRTEFLGRGGRPSAPAGLRRTTPLSGRTGAGLDPCTALLRVVEIPPGGSVEVVATLGECATAEEASTLVARYRTADLDAVLAAVEEHWTTILGAVSVRTPDRAMDLMLNGWLLYQSIACRITARSAFYQASGAYGFRDQLQDGMALSFTLPETTRSHLLRAASRQFVEGDVQHWWLPPEGRGVRTRISDDRVWLAYATATYLATSGDAAVLDEVVPFIEGPELREGEHDDFFEPMPSGESGTLFEHCARGLDQALELTGALGLPLMGTGDWNDGMNRVGEGGQGESVWLGWLLVDTIARFAPWADARDPERAARWRAHATSVREALEREAWDGAWYRRATFDDGTWLGTASGEACRIDSIAQSWAVLSGAADPERARTAMASVQEHLVRPDDGLALLFTPPFDDGPLDPGYIKGYPPGLRENGGQYSHAAMWAILAHARLGQGDEAAALFDLINPVRHALDAEGVERYQVEPFVVAADVYSVAPHVGRGGWTWYTGSAGWMYRAGVEGILGLRRAGDQLIVDPCIPAAWPGFEATVAIGTTRYAIVVHNVADRATWDAELDGEPHRPTDGVVRVPIDGGRHRLVLAARTGTSGTPLGPDRR